ncbi:hypothetical protein Q4F19_14935 [Sphingomonas sp. BIUV-7]|uniref:DUF6894 domain-containing protein n=1 Tax=Sphingomonas natans TaxID=3063330 RepID=A0ABT8YBG9_9SPHN|nr:hypothetical protein [Sphingomonas sp. BIUV-7]MDO6415683.1 hypothetical protein [Sphingomonas sp. BIUV-7]
MPRYFFSTANGERHPDDEGLDLPNHAAARVAAIKYAGAIMENEPDVLWDGQSFQVEVTDDRGLILFTIVSIAINAPGGGDGG